MISQSIISPPTSIKQIEIESIIDWNTSIISLLSLVVDSGPSNTHLTTFLSTQPFSILDLNENDFSSLQLFNHPLSPVSICSPSQLSGQIASQYQNQTLFRHAEITPKIKSKKKKTKRLNYSSRRSMFLKKQLKSYLKKKQKKSVDSDQIQTTSTVMDVQQYSTPIEEYPSMISPSVTPDLSKRKYIYKDITTTTNNANQINWVSRID